MLSCVEYHLWPMLNRARQMFVIPIDSSSSLLCCNSCLPRCYIWNHVVVSKHTTDRRSTNRIVLAYRVHSPKELVSSRICSSLMSRVCRIVVFFGCPATDLVTTVPYLSNLWIVWHIQRRKIFSCRLIVNDTSLCIRSTQVNNIWTFPRNVGWNFI